MDISQFYQFNSIDQNNSVIVRRGEGAPKITSGGARWRIVNRPKRTSIVLFDGSDPYRIDVPVLFDGWSDSKSVEVEISKLNQMSFSQAELTRPSRIRVDGALPVKGATWVIESLTWGDNIIWDSINGQAFRYRQDCIVHLLQYVPEQVLAGVKPFKIGDKIVINKSGQTIKDHAKGDPKKTKAIQKANNVRDIKTVKAGDRLRIPGQQFPPSKFG